MSKRWVRYSCLFMLVALASSPVFAGEPTAGRTDKPTKRIAAGNSQSLYIDDAGQLWAWGDTRLKGADPHRPTRVMTHARSVSAGLGFPFSLVIKQDGSLWGWGSSYHGESGVITDQDIDQPVRILPAVKSVETSWHTIFAIKPDNSLWAWGSWGWQRGDRIEKMRAEPRKVLDKVKQVRVSPTHTLALREDGSLWAWGDNLCGALGNGTTERSYIPQKVNLKKMGESPIISITNNTGDSYAVTADGKLWGWGEYNVRQMKCANKPTLIPTRITGMDNVQDAAAGRRQLLILKKDGTVWSRGGMLTPKEQPRITDGEFTFIMGDVREIAMGDTHSIALKKDGTVWTWGFNEYGELGDGTNTKRAEPGQVLFPADSTRE